MQTIDKPNLGLGSSLPPFGCRGHHNAVPHTAVGALYLSPTEIDRVAAYLSRTWHGATGLNAKLAAEQISIMVEIMLRKAREEIRRR